MRSSSDFRSKARRQTGCPRYTALAITSNRVTYMASFRAKSSRCPQLQICRDSSPTTVNCTSADGLIWVDSVEKLPDDYFKRVLKQWRFVRSSYLESIMCNDAKTDSNVSRQIGAGSFSTESPAKWTLPKIFRSMDFLIGRAAYGSPGRGGVLAGPLRGGAACSSA